MASVLRAFGFGLALGGDGVGGFAGLRDQQGDGVGANDGIAIAPFAGVIDFHRDAGEALDHELAGLSGVPTGAASDDVDFFRGAEFGLADFHLVEKDVAGVLRDAAEGGVAHGARLLVNFLEHEVLEAALFRHDRVPGDVLHLALDGLAVEVGELDAVGSDDGEVAVGRERKGRGCDRESRERRRRRSIRPCPGRSRAGGPLRAATILFGSSTEITPRAKTPVSSFTALRTASSSGGRWPLPVLKRCFSIRWAMTSVSVSVVNLWPSSISFFFRLR